MLFRTDYTSFEDIVHTSDVIPLVPDAKIPNRPMFRYSPSDLQEMHTQVDALLKHGLIHKSSSPFGSPILLRNGQWGAFCSMENPFLGKFRLSSVPVFQVFHGTKGSPFANVLVFHCSTIPVFHCSTVPLFQCSKCSTIPLFQCSTVLVFHWSTVPVFQVF
jgi:hypothetical protein